MPCASFQPARRRLDTAAANVEGGNVKALTQTLWPGGSAKHNNFVSSDSAEFEKLFIALRGLSITQLQLARGSCCQRPPPPPLKKKSLI